jgi:hypothetical protein
MKGTICFFLVVGLALFGYGFAQAGSDEGPPTLTASGPDTMDKKATVMISGSGFTPGQEINLVFTAADDMQSDIGYALKEAPKADANGNWSASWKCYDFIRRKMVKAGGSYKITATDNQYAPLAHTMITFNK